MPDSDKGQRVPRALWRHNPGFFLRLLAASKTQRIAFAAVAIIIVSWWFQNAALLSIIGLLLVLELGPWSWPRQMIWQAVTLHDVIAAILAQMGYRRADIVDGWYIWAGPQHRWKPWRSAPRLCCRAFKMARSSFFALAGDRWALQRLRKLFDSKQFKVEPASSPLILPAADAVFLMSGGKRHRRSGGTH